MSKYRSASSALARSLVRSVRPLAKLFLLVDGLVQLVGQPHDLLEMGVAVLLGLEGLPSALLQFLAVVGGVVLRGVHGGHGVALRLLQIGLLASSVLRSVFATSSSFSSLVTRLVLGGLLGVAAAA